MLFLVYTSLVSRHGVQSTGGLLPWADPRNVTAMINSLFVGTGMAFVLVVGGFGLALLFRAIDLTGHPLVYALSVVPLLVPDFAYGVAGRALLDPSFGVFANLVPPDFLIDRASALVLVIAVASLKWLPVMTLVADAGLAAMDPREKDQVRLDFPGFFDAARAVYIPRLAGEMALVGSLAFLIGFRQHELAIELTSSGGGFAAELWSPWNQRVIFEFADVTDAALEALFVLPLLIGIMLVIKAKAQQALREDT